MPQTIGIITFHCSYNYGSALQAYALQAYLNKNDKKVKVIDFVLKSDFEQYHLFRTSLYKKHIKVFVADLLFFPKNYKRKKNFSKFLKTYIELTEKTYFDSEQMRELNQQFDTFICGSDQIWNLACTRGIVPAYFLGFANDEKRKIAYAPSIAHLTFEDNLIQGLSYYLNRLDAISVREKSTIQVISSLTDKPVYHTLDPTLLLRKEDYTSIISPQKTSKYIFVYMLEYCENLIQYVCKLSHKTGMKIIHISRRGAWKYHHAKNVYGCSPNDFLSYIHYADYIVTNSFHATVFSIIFQKKFCTFKTKHSFSRMVDLLESVGLSKRLYKKQFDISQEIDFCEVNKKLEELKKDSMDFLERSLK